MKGHMSTNQVLGSMVKSLEVDGNYLIHYGNHKIH